ncbi:hypothetical protein MJO29_015218 [Puccinia striiformis f. sp. tritici]|nr:hypothetical protein MJO29_015218 [Puccinia striiformis f. sp. tritici]
MEVDGDSESKKTTANKPHQPNLREINRLLKNLAKDRPNPAPPQSSLNEDEDDENAENTGSNCGGENNDGLDRSADDNGGDDHNVDDNDDHVGEDNVDDDDGEGKRFVPVPEDVMDDIVGMDLDELREYEALHAENKRLPAYLKADAQLRTITSVDSIPKPERFSPPEEPLKVRCKEVGKLWATIDPETKAEYKDAAYIETIRGDIPMLVTANGSIQTARKTHVAKTTLNLASNQSSITFVKRWAKDTIKRMNEIAACHRIQGF